MTCCIISSGQTETRTSGTIRANTFPFAKEQVWTLLFPRRFGDPKHRVHGQRRHLCHTQHGRENLFFPKKNLNKKWCPSLHVTWTGELWSWFCFGKMDCKHSRHLALIPNTTLTDTETCYAMSSHGFKIGKFVTSWYDGLLTKIVDRIRNPVWYYSHGNCTKTALRACSSWRLVKYRASVSCFYCHQMTLGHGTRETQWLWNRHYVQVYSNILPSRDRKT